MDKTEQKPSIRNWYCYKYYDKQGRRLTAKAELIATDKSRLFIHVLPCPKKHRFCKKEGRDWINSGICLTQKMYAIPLIDPDKPRDAFFDFMNTYFTKPGMGYYEYYKELKPISLWG